MMGRNFKTILLLLLLLLLLAGWLDGFAHAPPGATEEANGARGPWGHGRAGFRRQSEAASVAFAGAAVKGSHNPTEQSSATGN
jgi:hypothetical protein